MEPMCKEKNWTWAFKNAGSIIFNDHFFFAFGGNKNGAYLA